MLRSLLNFLRNLLKSTNVEIPEQWSKEEREELDRRGKPPLKINLVKSTNDEIAKHKFGVERVKEIEREISETVICNVEFVKWSKKFRRSKKGRRLMKLNPKGFYRSHVIYMGKETWAAFYDMKQTEEVIRKMAWHIYEKEIPSFKRR